MKKGLIYVLLLDIFYKGIVFYDSPFLLGVSLALLLIVAGTLFLDSGKLFGAAMASFFLVPIIIEGVFLYWPIVITGSLINTSRVVIIYSVIMLIYFLKGNCGEINPYSLLMGGMIFGIGHAFIFGKLGLAYSLFDLEQLHQVFIFLYWLFFQGFLIGYTITLLANVFQKNRNAVAAVGVFLLLLFYQMAIFGMPKSLEFNILIYGGLIITAIILPFSYLITIGIRKITIE